MNLKNIIGMGYGVLKGNILRRKIPLNVMYSVTDRCPSRCGYCKIPSREKKELTTAQAFTLIDQIAVLGCQRLGLWGGEPLVRDDIGEIIDHAKDRGLFVTLDSNGYLIPEKIKVLKRLDHLVLAFDGSEAAHDSNREKGSFQKVMSAIETLSGRMPFWAITVLTKHNLNDIDFILDKAREYGFLATFQLPHHNNKLAPDNSAFLAEDAAYRKAIKKLIAEKKKGAPIASGLKYLYHILRWKDYKNPVSSETINNLQCHAGRFYCNVDTDGSLYPCSLQADKTDSFNFLEFGFKKAFENLNRGSCEGCMASCFTEYNYLYSLDVFTVFEWMMAMRRGHG
jgi:MoaA/NifB/PqqE/SkfB family radical SAM enzyme